MALGQDILSFEDLSKKDKKKYDKALQHIKNKKFEKALNDVKTVIFNNPNFVEGQLKLINLYLKNKNDSLAVNHLMYVIDNSLSRRPDVRMTLVDELENMDRYEEALSYIKPLTSLDKLNPKHKKIVKRRYEELKFRSYAYANPVEFDPEPISRSINTDKSESLPAFNADGSIMIYTSIDLSAGRNSHEDLYISYVNQNGEFSKGTSIDELNTFENEGAHTFSQDGTTVIFTACNRPDSYGGCDLYISFFKNGKWSKAYNMGPNINSRYAEKQPSLSPDNKTLFFSSTRRGGLGKEDIWKVSFESGNWGKPQNLGSTINSKGNEGSPYLHPDNQTLYFRSDGHIGLGGYDLFLSRKENNSWSKPQNLGYPINSKTNDGALFVDLSGNYAYYTSDKFTEGKHLDILKFKLPEEVKPQPVSYLKVIVNDISSQKRIDAKVAITNHDNYKAHYFSSTLNGYTTVINKGHYAVNISKENYIFHSENIQIDSSATHFDPIIYEIDLKPIEKETIDSSPTILKNIFFKSGSADLLDISNTEIENLYQLLIDRPDIRIQIIGHTDNIGKDLDNESLSLNRAKSVYNALIQKGIDASRLSYVGKGESEPIASNDTEEGRQTNRRTTFIIIP